MEKLLFTIIIATGLLICACNKNKKTDPKPETPTNIDPTPVIRINGIRLYNQYVDTVDYPDFYKFYNITNQSYNNSVKFPFQIAFVFANSKYHLGSANSTLIKSEHKVPSGNPHDIEFYRIINITGSYLFDTLSLSSSFDDIFNNYTVKSYTNGESNLIQSGASNWIAGYVIGFKLNNDKRGLIKLNAEPTGIYRTGSIQFNIKMEK
jgi:hypothetical protein